MYNPPSISPLRKSISLLVIALVLLLALAASCFAQSQPTTHTESKAYRVLVVHSYHPGFTWTDKMMAGIRETFASSGFVIETYVDYLDTKRLEPTEEYLTTTRNLYRIAYKNISFDVIVATDIDALGFLKRYREELFPGVPVVFTGVDASEPAIQGDLDNATGVTRTLDFKGTVQIALKLRPKTKNIVIVSDNTSTGRQWHLEAEEQLPVAFPQVKFRTLLLSDTTLGALKRELSALPNDSVIYYLQGVQDKNGQTYPPDYVASYLLAHTSVPAFVAAENRLGTGVLGGSVSSGVRMGESAARIAIALFQGKEISNIPVQGCPSSYIFDYNVMKRFGVTPSDLPLASVILNQPPSIFKQYRLEVTVAIVVFGAGLIVVFLLLFENARRTRMANSLRESEERFRAVLEQASDGVELLNANGQFMGVNPAACHQLGYSREEMLRLTVMDIDPQITLNIYKERFQALATTPSMMFETSHKRKDDSSIPVETSISRLQLGGIDHMMAITRDISSRKQAELEKIKLEDQLRQAQKMEAVGRLAGGVAHDFNNMLSVILGYCDILQSDISPESPLFSAVEEITNAANRSAELTRQLLAFSRKQAVAPRAINLTEHLRGMERLLKRTIGEDVQLEFIFPPDLWEVFMDPSQIDQIAANLAVNSRDAMPNGGKLTIETRNVTLGTEFGQVYDDFHPGDYVILNVNDTGCGMTKETLEHIFEPFFTTKGEGKGTGLGMATVYGVVHQNNGLVKIYSEPGYGTAVSIYLPRYQDLRQAESAIAPPPEAKVHFGTETILLVEDEAQLRQLILRQLKSLGYEVLEASLPNEALALCDKYTNRIDLLLTDIIMPGGMNGQELSKKIQEMRSDIHILFMSGYTADTIAQHGVLNSDVHFLQKPFSKEALANKLRKALNN